MLSFLKNCKITRVANAASAGTTDIDSSRVDMSGFDSVAFVAVLGDVTSGSVITLLAKENTADSTSGASAISGATTTQTTAGAADMDNKLLAVDVHRPSLRYVYATLVIDTQNAVVDGIFAIQYNARSLPVSQGSTVFEAVFKQAG